MVDLIGGRRPVVGRLNAFRDRAGQGSADPGLLRLRRGSVDPLRAKKAKRSYAKLYLALILPGLLLAVFLRPAPGQAQEGSEVTYTVQTGDTLTRIALKYNLRLAELAAYNDIANPNLILAGQTLRIPAPAPLPASVGLAQTYTVKPGDTLGNIAARFGLTVDQLAAANNISNVDLIDAGQALTIALGDAPEGALLPYPFESITLSEPVIPQGHTLLVTVTLAEPAELSVEFEDRPVFVTGDGPNYWGIVGVHALQEIGLYSLAFRATTSTGQLSAVAQNVTVMEGPYGTETIQIVEGREGLLSPDVIQAEAERMWALWSQVTLQPYWSGSFGYPVNDVRITSAFGTRRSYNGGPANSFHAGSDFGGGIGAPIYAPAAGQVVLAESLAVRGNAVLIDHGLGLFSGYWHQSEIVAEAGQFVQPGDLIGYIGDTGLVTGPHLHWEMRLGGIAVEPLQWVVETFP